MDTESAQRRLHPRTIDSDWLVLRDMRPAIEKVAAQVARAARPCLCLRDLVSSGRTPAMMFRRFVVTGGS
jgi:hypothetical protein